MFKYALLSVALIIIATACNRKEAAPNSEPQQIKGKWDMDCTSVGNNYPERGYQNMIRCENAEVVCYDNHYHGYQCKFKTPQ